MFKLYRFLVHCVSDNGENSEKKRKITFTLSRINLAQSMYSRQNEKFCLLLILSSYDYLGVERFSQGN